MVALCQGTGKLAVGEGNGALFKRWLDWRKTSSSAAGWFGSMKVDAQARETPVVRMCQVPPGFPASKELRNTYPSLAASVSFLKRQMNTVVK